MHLSSLPCLEPSKLLLYLLNFLPLLYSTISILHSTLQYFSIIFIETQLTGIFIILSCTSKFSSHFTTHLSSHDSFLFHKIYSASCSAVLVNYFPLYSIIRYFLCLTLSGFNFIYHLHNFSKYFCIVLSFSHFSWLLCSSQY